MINIRIATMWYEYLEKDKRLMLDHKSTKRKKIHLDKKKKSNLPSIDKQGIVLD